VRVAGGGVTCRECGHERKIIARDLCRSCYGREYNRVVAEGGEALDRWRIYNKKNAPKGPCACGRKHYAHGLCRRCYAGHPVHGAAERERFQQYKERNGERIKANRRAYYKRTKGLLKHPSVTRLETLRLHGLTRDGYDAMFAAQGGRCAICHKTERESATKGRLAVDHSHETGQIRGLLCTRCNTAIGMLGDDVAGVWAALDYLTKAQPLRLLGSGTAVG
jgi:hypothetical protein